MERLLCFRLAACLGALDPGIHLAQALGVIGALGSLAVAYNAWRTWKNSELWWWTRIQEAAILVACAGYFWFCWNWNLFKFDLRF